VSALENASRRKSVATREEPRLSYVRALSLSGFHRIAVWEWGKRDPDKVPIVCAHGLTRQARDFDVLARRLVRRGRHVICPDLAGRGFSDWLRDPSHYNLSAVNRTVRFGSK
jgi:pimeloyl-ACP methyl ester carboxylesterase